jgi:DNA-directed RNA polymerase I and III subunit RPAC1
VPTIAFEHIYIKNNTSVIVDEVLAHRIGLIPIQVDPRPFLFQGKGEPPSDNVLILILILILISLSLSSSSPLLC